MTPENPPVAGLDAGADLPPLQRVVCPAHRRPRTIRRSLVVVATVVLWLFLAAVTALGVIFGGAMLG